MSAKPMYTRVEALVHGSLKEPLAKVVPISRCNCKETLLLAIAGRGDFNKQEKEKFAHLIGEVL